MSFSHTFLREGVCKSTKPRRRVRFLALFFLPLLAGYGITWAILTRVFLYGRTRLVLGKRRHFLQPPLLFSQACRFHPIVGPQFLYSCGKMIAHRALGEHQSCSNL